MALGPSEYDPDVYNVNNNNNNDVNNNNNNNVTIYSSTHKD